MKLQKRVFSQFFKSCKNARFMPVVGLEPTRHCWQRILSPHRLPFRHTGEQQQVQYSKICGKMQA